MLFSFISIILIVCVKRATKPHPRKVPYKKWGESFAVYLLFLLAFHSP